MVICIERVIKLFPSLKNYFVFENWWKGWKGILDNKIKNRLIAALKHPLAEAILMFLHAALPLLINLNLLLQRSDLLIQIFYDALFTCVKQLFSRFASPELVRKFANGDITIIQIKGEIIKDENILDTSKMFVGFLQCSKLNELLDEGDISEREFDIFHKSVHEFHDTAFIYAITNLSTSFITQLLFMLSTTFLYRMSFCSTHDS